MGKDFGAELAAQAGLSSLVTAGPFRGGCAVGAIEGYPVVAGCWQKS